jgi:hypothetical protein
MAAYPFRKMTTQQLRRILKDDQERNRHLIDETDRPDNDPPVALTLRIQPISPQTSEIPTESC